MIVFNKRPKMSRHRKNISWAVFTTELPLPHQPPRVGLLIVVFVHPVTDLHAAGRRSVLDSDASMLPLSNLFPVGVLKDDVFAHVG